MQISKVIDEIIILAKQENLDWQPHLDDTNEIFMLFHKKRYIFVFERDKRIGYAISGTISILPSQYEKSISCWNGFWNEGGYVENAIEAFALIKAWLFEEKEVHDLPKREVRSTGIG